MASIQETLALLKTSKNKYAGGTGGAVKLKEGKTRARILNDPTNPIFWRDAGKYWIKDAVKGGKVLAVPGSTSICYGTDEEPVEDAVLDAITKAQLSASTDEEVELYKSWKANKEVLVNALIFDGPDAGPNPQILSLTPNTFSSYLSVMETYTESGVDVFCPEKGIDVIFEKRGKGLDTEYGVMAAPVSKPFSPELMKNLKDLDAFVQREYFRAGEDRKALTAISQLTGLSFAAPALAAPRSPSAGALTGTAAKLADLASTVTPTVDPAADAATLAKAAAEAQALADAKVAQAKAKVAAEKAAAAAAAKAAAAKVETVVAEVVEEEDDDAKELAALLARQKAAKAAKAAAAAATLAVATVAPDAVQAETPAVADDFGASLDVDDLERTMRELEGL